MMKPLLNYLAVFSCCSLMAGLASCGRGGMTLSGGDVNAIWMPDETYVNVNTGTVEVIYDSNGNPHYRTVSARSDAVVTVPESLMIGTGQGGEGVLFVDGMEYPARISYRQEGLTFVLAVETNDGQYRLLMNDGVLESADSSRASGSLGLHYQSVGGGYVAQSSHASLFKKA